MKIAAGRADGFCAAPDAAIRIVLLHGANEGLVRTRAETCVRAVAGGLDDPFRVSILDGAALRSEPARLRDAASALSLTGGRTVVRLRGASDALTPAFRTCFPLPPGDGLVIAEAGVLPPRSSLRLLCEKERSAAAIACHEDDGRSAADLIAALCTERSIAVEPETAAWLAERLGTDRRQIENEIEKLATFLGGPEDGKPALTLEAAQAGVGDAGRASADEIALLAASGDPERLDRAMTRALYAGLSPITMLRAASRHLVRLHLAAARVAAGESRSGAMRGLRPPVFHREQAAFLAQMAQWRGDSAGRAMAFLMDAERDCKSGRGSPELLCRHALLRVADRVRQRRPGS